MEEFLDTYVSVQEGRVTDALLHRSLNFAKPRSFRALHSLRWRLLMGLLPVNVSASTYSTEWARYTQKGVQEWNTMNDALMKRIQTDDSSPKRSEKKGRFGESDSSDEETEGRVVENPLLPTAGSSYAFRYNIDKIRATAQKDIDRLHWDLPLFEQPTTKETLLLILVNYCLRHNRDYKQGMHEIAAFILYVIHNDTTLVDELQGKNEGTHTLLFSTFRSVYPEDGKTALSFQLFEIIMNAPGMNLSQWYYTDDEHAPDSIVSAAQKVQGECLAKLDPALHQQMNTIYEIEGTSYLIRWLRLIFLREFSLVQCADLWDLFLCEKFLVGHGEYHLIDSTITMLAASMLLFVRNELMVGCIAALKRLMKYPPVEDVGVLVEKTISQIDSQKSGLGRYFTPSHHVSLAEPQLVSKSLVEYASTPPPTLSLREVMLQQGVILTSIIEGFERQCFPSPSVSREESDAVRESYLRSIAQLKKVRDVLLHQDDDSDP